MQFVEANLLAPAGEGPGQPAECVIVVDSEDGRPERQAFNSMVTALAPPSGGGRGPFVHRDAVSTSSWIWTSQALQQLMRRTDASAGAILVETDGDE
jgi:hypothetical protein